MHLAPLGATATPRQLRAAVLHHSEWPVLGSTGFHSAVPLHQRRLQHRPEQRVPPVQRLSQRHRQLHASTHPQRPRGLLRLAHRRHNHNPFRR